MKRFLTVLVLLLCIGAQAAIFQNSFTTNALGTNLTWGLPSATDRFLIINGNTANPGIFTVNSNGISTVVISGNGGATPSSLPALSIAEYLSLNLQTNRLTMANNVLLLDGAPITSTATTPVNNFYVTNLFVQNGAHNTMVISNSLTIQPVKTNLLATTATGLVTNANYGTGISWDPTTRTLSASVGGTAAFTFLGSGASAVIQANYTNINNSTATATNSFLIIGGSDNSSTNGILLTNAVGFANAATPGGSAKAQNNRFTIFLLPGTYTVSDGALVLTKEFVDLVGISTETGTRTVSAAGYVLGETVISSTGDTLTINAAGNDDITLANLCIVTSSAGGKDAVKMTTTGTLQKMINLFIRNTSALGNHATPIAQNWAGYYEDVRNWNDSAFSSSGTCSGTFIRCKANNFAFSENGTASGLFIDCEADNGFGGNTCSGTFIRCRFVSVSGTQNVFGFRNGATVSGTLIECIGSGNTTDFGGNSGTMSGTMRYCQNSALPAWTSVTGSLIGCDFPTSTAVNIAATGYTNLFGRNTVVYFDGTAVTATVFNGAGTSIYTNAVATTGMGTVILEKGGKVILSGTGVVGRAIPYRGL